MKKSMDRIVIGATFIVVGFIGLLAYIDLFVLWRLWRLPTLMMSSWDVNELVEVSGEVEEIKQMKIKLKVNGEEIEVHGPTWFWDGVGLKVGDKITVKGVFVFMMEPHEGCHLSTKPF